MSVIASGFCEAIFPIAIKPDAKRKIASHNTLAMTDRERFEMNDELKADWIRTLERLRFDVTRRDPLQAHRADGARRVVDVTLDESGQIKMVVTRQTGETKSARITSRAGREYQVFGEQNSVTIVTYRLKDGDELRAVVSEMEKEIIFGQWA